MVVREPESIATAMVNITLDDVSFASFPLNRPLRNTPQPLG